MAYSYLLLGPVLFQDFELPASISWGGTHALTIHRLPGGGRVIDAMGRDDAEIGWTGVFSGSDAGLRARAVDLMRGEGALWPLTWDSYFYSVVVSRFEADYRRPNWIPYRIACTVLRDEAEAVVRSAISTGASVLADLTAAAGFDTGLDLTGPTMALALAGATTRGTAAYSTTQRQISLASTTNDVELADAGSQLTNASSLSQATSLAGQSAQRAATRGYLQRAGVNLTNASS